MRFTDVWTHSAEMELAELWQRACDRAAVGKAANDIDASLRDNPQTRGESRADCVRILHNSPLGVLFEVSESDRRVRVIDVWHFESPP